MATNRKLGKTTDQRLAMLKTQTTSFFLNGKIETTEARAKEVRSIAENLIALAIREKDNFETVEDITNMTESEMMKVRNLGKKSLDEVTFKLHSLGLDFTKEEE